MGLGLGLALTLTLTTLTLTLTLALTWMARWYAAALSCSKPLSESASLESSSLCRESTRSSGRCDSPGGAPPGAQRA